MGVTEEPIAAPTKAPGTPPPTTPPIAAPTPASGLILAEPATTPRLCAAPLNLPPAPLTAFA